jgi:hypothetical protein
MTTIPIDENRAVGFLKMEQVIAVKGKIPRVGERVKISSYPSAEKVYASVHEVSPDGIPVKVKLDDGKIIELVGYLVQLINLVEAIFQAIKELFNKDQEVQVGYYSFSKS